MCQGPWKSWSRDRRKLQWCMPDGFMLPLTRSCSQYIRIKGLRAPHDPDDMEVDGPEEYPPMFNLQTEVINVKVNVFMVPIVPFAL